MTKKRSFEYNLMEIRKNNSFTEEYEIDCMDFRDSTSPLTKLKSATVYVNFHIDGNDVILSGKVSINATTICSRCGKEIDISMIENFEEVYSGEETVDIKDVISEAITLAEPIRVLCKDLSCNKVKI